MGGLLGFLRFDCCGTKSYWQLDRGDGNRVQKYANLHIWDLVVGLLYRGLPISTSDKVSTIGVGFLLHSGGFALSGVNF